VPRRRRDRAVAATKTTLKQPDCRNYGAICHNYGMAKRKTTLMIEEGLYDAIRVEAAKNRTSVSAFVAEATRVYMAEAKKPRGKTVLPTFSGAGFKFPSDVNPDSNSEVLDYLDRVEDPEGKHPRLL
jgi:hypothetical protein